MLFEPSQQLQVLMLQLQVRLFKDMTNGSSWEIPIEGFHRLVCTFFAGLLVLFNGLAFCFEGRAHEFTRR